MKIVILTLSLCCIVLGNQSCTTSSAKDIEDIEKQKFAAERNPVEVMVLDRSTFNKEMVSNGKLKAFRKCELQFETTGQVSDLFVKNGKLVKANSTIAILHQQDANQKLKQAEIQFKKAELDRFELLIGQGYNAENIDSIPKSIVETADIRSGYSQAKNGLEEARLSMNKHSLNAPFSGKIANLECKRYEYVNSGKAFCTLIDDSRFEVEFSVLESELKEITQGLKISIQPFSLSKKFTGYIHEINPLIDENGMVKIKALVNNPGGLMEGMNVKIIIKKSVSEQLVVPKSAVLIRQNKEVLFRVKSGKAFWTYVHTLHENSNSRAVIANTDRGADLNVGDTIIVSGNLNLAHESEVEVDK